VPGNRSAFGFVPSRLEPAVLPQAQDHYRSGRSRAGRNRSTVDPAAGAITADQSSRCDRGHGRCLAQRGSRAHPAHAGDYRAHGHPGCARGRVSAGAAQGRNRTLGAAIRLRIVGGSMDAATISRSGLRSNATKIFLSCTIQLPLRWRTRGYEPCFPIQNRRG